MDFSECAIVIVIACNMELATLTPVAWVDLFSRRLSPWQQQQNQQRQPQPHPAVPPVFLGGSANQIVKAHVQSSPFRFLSTASQIGATASCISALMWVGTVERICWIVNSCLSSTTVPSCLLAPLVRLGTLAARDQFGGSVLLD